MSYDGVTDKPSPRKPSTHRDPPPAVVGPRGGGIGDGRPIAGKSRSRDLRSISTAAAMLRAFHRPRASSVCAALVSSTRDYLNIVGSLSPVDGLHQ